MTGLFRALWALYHIDRKARAEIVAAVQFMEGQHLATGLQVLFRGFPARPEPRAWSTTSISTTSAKETRPET